MNLTGLEQRNILLLKQINTNKETIMSRTKRVAIKSRNKAIVKEKRRLEEKEAYEDEKEVIK